jgi:hypothetical protein
MHRNFAIFRLDSYILATSTITIEEDCHQSQKISNAEIHHFSLSNHPTLTLLALILLLPSCSVVVVCSCCIHPTIAFIVGSCGKELGYGSQS